VIARLSDHQRDIAVLHSDGLRRLQIAARLGLSDRSVKKALERIMAVGRDELVRLAGTALAGDCGQRSGGSPLLAPSSAADAPPVGDVAGCGVPTAPGSLGALEGAPEQIVNRVVAYAHDHGFPPVTADTVRSANAVHGATVSGGRSDHQGPPDFAWAADISNGGSPTPEEDALARTLATAFDLSWPGAGSRVLGRGPAWRRMPMWMWLKWSPPSQVR